MILKIYINYSLTIQLELIKTLDIYRELLLWLIISRPNMFLVRIVTLKLILEKFLDCRESISMPGFSKPCNYPTDCASYDFCAQNTVIKNLIVLNSWSKKSVIMPVNVIGSTDNGLSRKNKTFDLGLNNKYDVIMNDLLSLRGKMNIRFGVLRSEDLTWAFRLWPFRVRSNELQNIKPFSCCEISWDLICHCRPLRIVRLRITPSVYFDCDAERRWILIARFFISVRGRIWYSHYNRPF